MKKPLNNLIGLFLTWRVSLFLAAIIGQLVWTFKASFPYFDKELIVTGLPNWVWGFGNFDGVHYLRIVKYGYSLDFTQVFFPIYPLLIKLFSFISPFWSGLLTSNLAFLGGLFILYKLWLLDFDQRIVKKSLIFLVAFPTAFYFGAIYTESIFLLLVVSCLYALRRHYFITAGLLAAFASATRVVGVLLFVVILIETWPEIKKLKIRAILSLILTPLGLICYMAYLGVQFRNPIYFLTAQTAFGADRNATSLVLLPQVIFRYLKILFTTWNKGETFWIASFELFSTVVGLLVLALFIKKVRLSYWLFSFSCFLIPTLTGTLSSMPRYILMSFLIVPAIILNLKKYKLVVLLMWLSQLILVSLFVRGYWVE